MGVKEKVTLGKGTFLEILKGYLKKGNPSEKGYFKQLQKGYLRKGNLRKGYLTSASTLSDREVGRV